ncbi:polyamine ABC transporter substrate-binding protein [Marinomonas pollencensis]|uniref:Putrescine-binding periplasmic protein n=1 Tax=Marinomonas pollencensis TaxID=491954 RepID=A0A3E0DUX1_9GAMM|nr:polyamine ABC transporter substrate-binding protein [Marinomonas pollencensis]REG86665.1 putrescine transport system substrate-binding protein [Marinomonas pollencensis]
MRALKTQKNVIYQAKFMIQGEQKMKMSHACISAVCAAFISSSALAEDKVLNIYNWSDYITPDAVANFEKETGIKVNYDVYDSNEALEAKLMAGSSGYDLVFPSNSFFERQVKAGAYQTIDKSLLSNYKNIDQQLASKVAQHDEGNLHNVPYAWGTVGIGYNIDMVKERLGDDFQLDSLDVLLKPEVAAKLQDCGIAVLDSPAEVMSIVNNYIGEDPNSESLSDLKASAKVLSEARPYYKYFHSSQYISDLANGDICVALGYNGDLLQAKDRALEAGQGVNIGFSIPREGTLLWFDLMAIPADAPHPQAALKYINYILRGDVAASLSNYVFYAVPNTAATPMLDTEISENKGVYPVQAVKDKLFIQVAHTPKFDRSLTRTWSNIKTGR